MEYHLQDKDALAGLDEFTVAYIESMFWTDNAPGVTTEEWQATEEHEEGSFPDDVGAADLAPESLAKIVKDCAAFQEQAGALLELAYAGDYTPGNAGHDFWLTRNHHGAGFWDREALKPDSEAYESLTDEMVANRDNPPVWNEALRKRSLFEADGLGHKLTQLAHTFGEVYTELGDDGKVYAS